MTDTLTVTRDSDGDVLTPRLRTRARRSVFWVVLAAFGLLVVAAVYLLSGDGAAGAPALDPTSAAPEGAKAVVEVLRSEGVEVTTVESAAAALTSLEDIGGSSTLVIVDNAYLEPARIDVLTSAAGSVVVIDPSFATLRAISPDVLNGGSTDTESVDAACDLPAAERAERAAVENTFRIDGDVTGCFPVDGERFGLATVPGSTTTTVVGSPAVFANGSIAQHGNAALALGLLGTSDRLVWYLPSLADVEADAPPTIGELTPGWVVPCLLLLVIATVAAGFWRGRRFGPLVVEPLPVTVRADETMEGRARLYQRSSARLRAVDALRIGTIDRIASRLDLSRQADAQAVAAAAAALTGREHAEIRAILIDAVPRTDADLVGMSDALTILENQIHALTDPTGRQTR
jgi:hypothetical protein